MVQICTQYAQSGMLNIFLECSLPPWPSPSWSRSSSSAILISIATFGLYQAIFMANAGGAWDNAKKIVEVDLHAKGHRLA